MDQKIYTNGSRGHLLNHDLILIALRPHISKGNELSNISLLERGIMKFY